MPTGARVGRIGGSSVSAVAGRAGSRPARRRCVKVAVFRVSGMHVHADPCPCAGIFGSPRAGRAPPVVAQYQAAPKQRVEKAADLPRFNYKIDGKVEDLLRDDAKFKAFAQKLRTDIDSVLSATTFPTSRSSAATSRRSRSSTISKAATTMRCCGSTASGRSRRSRRTSCCPGWSLRAMIAAERKVGSRVTARLTGRTSVTAPRSARRDAVRRRAERGEARSKASAEIVGEPLILGGVRERLQPIVDKAGALSSEFAPSVVSARYRLGDDSPAEAGARAAPTRPISRRTRSTSPTSGPRATWRFRPRARYAPVNIAHLGQRRRHRAVRRSRRERERGKPAVIGFDRFEKPAQHRADGDSAASCAGGCRR